MGGLTQQQLTPVEVRAPRGAQQVDIRWASGDTTTYSFELLRGYCPCASCQGHQGPITFVGGDSSELLEIEEIGNYALRLVWPDCGSGLYTYRFLRQLAEPHTGDPKKRTLPR
ncbi:MAG: DUF971 domain-containing protein [Proteobacteria bacterium]|nr:DUF971 domain-containing protein [Pseudomonadota bacterium]